MCVYRARGGQAHSRSHFAYAGRITLFLLVFLDEVVNLLLTLGNFCEPSGHPLYPCQTNVRILLDRNNCSKIIITEHSFPRQTFLSVRLVKTVLKQNTREENMMNATNMVQETSPLSSRRLQNPLFTVVQGWPLRLSAF